MSKKVDETRASELAEKLEENSSRLTESHDGEGTTHQPVLEYLHKNEKIKYLFTARTKAIALGNKHSGESLAGDGKPTYIVTDSRILGIMPRIDGDELYKIPFDSLSDVDNNFGMTKWRMEIKTDNDTYHLWISPLDNDKENLNNAKNYLLSQTDEGIELTEDRLERFNRGVNVDVDVVTGSNKGSGHTNQAPATHLNRDEFIFFALENTQKGVGIGNKKDTISPVKHNNSYQTVILVTSSRVLAIIAQKNKDEVISIPYNSVLEVNCSLGTQKHRIQLSSDEEYHLWISGTYSRNILKDAAKTIRGLTLARQEAAQELGVDEQGIQYDFNDGEFVKDNSPEQGYTPQSLSKLFDNVLPPRFSPDEKFVVLDCDDSGSHAAELQILDRDMGKAELKTKGWNIGPRSWSSGRIEKESYEAKLYQFIVQKNGIQLTASDPDGGYGSRQIITRTFDEINSIDLSSNSGVLTSSIAFVFHTSSGIYRVEFGDKHDPTTELSKVVDYLRTNITGSLTETNNKQSSEKTGTSSEQNSNQTDTSSKLRELSKLKEEGIISQDEFNKKKAELLEDF